MRKVVAFLIVGAFCITLFSPPALALKDDPKRPRPELYGGNAHSYGDDSGWHDPHKSGLSLFGGLYIINWLSLHIVDIVVVNDLGNKENIDEHADNLNTIESRRPSSSK